MFADSTLWVFVAPGLLLGPYAQAPTTSPAWATKATAHKRVAEGLVEITQETAEGWRRVTVEQCYQIVPTLMTPVDEAPPSNVTASCRREQAGMLQGGVSRSPSASPARVTATRIHGPQQGRRAGAGPDEPAPASGVL
jgi:hypothetical protein